MEKTRVFQIGFDVAESNKTTQQDRDDLCVEIAHLIDNYCSIKGEPLGFKCVNGEFNIVDMSHAYGTEELKIINQK